MLIYSITILLLEKIIFNGSLYYHLFEYFIRFYFIRKSSSKDNAASIINSPE